MHRWPEDQDICPHKTLEEYLAKTKSMTENNNSGRVFIYFIKPYRPVSKTTVAQWIKTTLDNAGTDVGIFSAHSTRAASTSSA